MLPFPEGVKGYADGDSLRQLFSFSGLTFPRTHDIVWIPFREPCMSCVGASGDLTRAAGFFFFEALCRLLSSVPGANGQLDACFGTMGRWDVERGHGVDSRQNAYYNTRRQKKRL